MKEHVCVGKEHGEEGLSKDHFIKFFGASVPTSIYKGSRGRCLGFLWWSHDRGQTSMTTRLISAASINSRKVPEALDDLTGYIFGGVAG